LYAYIKNYCRTLTSTYRFATKPPIVIKLRNGENDNWPEITERLRMHLRRFAANTNSPNGRNHSCNVLPLSGFAQAHIVSLLRSWSFIRIAYAERNLVEPSRKRILQMVDLISQKRRKLTNQKTTEWSFYVIPNFHYTATISKLSENSANINIINDKKISLMGKHLPIKRSRQYD